MENENSAKVCICTIKTVQYLFTPTLPKSTAFDMIDLVRDALDKQKPKILTVDEFKSYYGLKS